MKTFNEHLNENESKANVPKDVKEFESLTDSKALHLKYVFFFNDKEINDSLLVTFSNNTDEFIITERAEYFRSTEWKTKDATSASNYMKLYMISKKFNNKKILDELKWCLVFRAKDKPNNSERVGIPWKKLAPIFFENIIRNSELKLKDAEYEALGITKTMRTGHKYGV